MPERVFADTNLFLRYLTNDVPTQADAVDQLLARAEAGDLVLVVSPLVIAEVVWALETFYSLDRPTVRDKVMAIANTPGIQVHESHLVIQACAWYVDANVDYADAWNAAWLQDQGLGAVYTFDRRNCRRISGLDVRGPGDAG